MSKVITVVLLLLVVAGVLAAYMNVFSDDAAVRKQAEAVAREKAACTDACKMIRIDGSRGVITEKLAFTFSGGRTTVVSCRRQFIAVGAYKCD